MIKVDIGRVAPTYRGSYETNTNYNELQQCWFMGN